MLLLIDALERVCEVDRIGAERMAGDLAMEDFTSDVGIVGGDLPPALIAGIGRDTDEADIFICEGLEFLDDHGLPRSHILT